MRICDEIIKILHHKNCFCENWSSDQSSHETEILNVLEVKFLKPSTPYSFAKMITLERLSGDSKRPVTSSNASTYDNISRSFIHSSNKKSR